MNLTVIVVVPGMVVVIEIAEVEDKEGSSFSVIIAGLCNNVVVIEGTGVIVVASLVLFVKVVEVVFGTVS